MRNVHHADQPSPMFPVADDYGAELAPPPEALGPTLDGSPDEGLTAPPQHRRHPTPMIATTPVAGRVVSSLAHVLTAASPTLMIGMPSWDRPEAMTLIVWASGTGAQLVPMDGSTITHADVPSLFPLQLPVAQAFVRATGNVTVHCIAVAHRFGA